MNRRYLSHIDPVVDPEGASAAYFAFPKGFTPPPPLVTMSASPGLLELQNRQIIYFRNHETLDAEFFATLRYILSDRYDAPDCLAFNADLLRRAAQYAEEDLDALLREPEKAPLPEDETALLLFVLDLVRDPGAINEDAVNDLRARGFSDGDVFDATFHATSFLGVIAFHKAFSAKDGE